MSGLGVHMACPKFSKCFSNNRRSREFFWRGVGWQRTNLEEAAYVIMDITK